MRGRIAPDEVGVAVSPRRRAQGLLREEAAHLAGISTTWYTWMEQARPTNPSLQVLIRLANALRLDQAESAHLINLARPDLATILPAVPERELPAPLTATLRGLAPYPVYVIDAHWNVVAWNDAAIMLFGDFGAIEPAARNILDLLFLDPSWHALFADWETVAETAIAQYRASTILLRDTSAWRARIAHLTAQSHDFARWWPRQDVRGAAVWRKTLVLPAGRIVFDYATLRPDAAYGEIQFVIYTPAADGPSRARFAKLINDKDSAGAQAKRAKRR